MKNTISTILIVFCGLFLSAQQSPLNVTLSNNLTENSGNVFDVDVRLSDFRDLYSFQLFMTWDSTVYRIDAATYVNEDIPSFTAQNIILPANDQNRPAKGKVRMIWSDAATLSLAENTLVATLRFTAIGDECEHSAFDLADIGGQESEQLLAADASFNNIGVTYERMTIQIPGVNCVSSQSDLTEMNSVKIYPNPVQDYLNLEIEGTIAPDTEVSIISIEGRQLAKYAVTSSQNSYDVTKLDAGTYLYEIRTASQSIKKGRIFKIN